MSSAYHPIMSLAGTLMTPRIDSKIHRTLYKHKKANFKDILRERFKQRIKENRKSLLEKFRSVSEAESNSCVQNTLSSFLRSEIQDFDASERNKTATFSNGSEKIDQEIFVEIMKEIEDELLEEEYNWILEECKYEEEQIDSLTSEAVCCPLCHRGIFQYVNINLLHCTNCYSSIRTTLNLGQFKSSLEHTLQEHSNFCIATPLFNLMNIDGSNTLCMLCDSCSLFVTY